MNLLLFFTISLVCFERLQMTISGYRLPRICRPTHYQIDLTVPETSLTNTTNTFFGKITISLLVSQTTSTIRLHASYQYIKINRIFLNTEINSSNYFIDTETDILTIALPNPVLQSPAIHTLTIEYSGILSTDVKLGFFKSSYVTSEGFEKYFAATHFQPIGARRAFPCFDEPSFKATFSLTITVPQRYHVLSNSPVTTNQNGIYRFAETPLMSTYIVAFVVLEFTFTTGQTIDGVSYQVYSQSQTSSYRAWALEIGPQILNSLNQYTQYNCNRTIHKVDQVAIPNFIGAMENWGLVTYRETSLLWDPFESTNVQKQIVTTTIAHQFSHFWFGNLVTLEWWSETYLNEGLATYFQYHISHKILRHFQLDKQFVVNIIHGTLRDDALDDAVPLESEVKTPSEINAKFGRITFYKGASIFNMLAHIMGNNNFKSALQDLLRTYAMRNIASDALLTLLAQAYSNLSDLPVELDIAMQNWVKTAGYPVVTVILGNGTVLLNQERFLLSGASNISSWYIPISYTTSVDENKFENTSPKAWLLPNRSLELSVPNLTSWIVLNNQQTYLYRVNYDGILWSRIARALLTENFGDITEINRAQIVDDLFTFVIVRRVTYQLVFNVIKFLERDTSYFPWVPAFRGFNYLLGRVGWETYIGRNITNHLSKLMTSLYDSTPFIDLNATDHIYTLKQVLALTWACKLGFSECIEISNVLFLSYKISGNQPPKNVRPIVYCSAIRNSTDRFDWDFLWSRYLNTTLSAERSNMLSSLGCSKDQNLLQEYLNKSITVSGIRAEDRHEVFVSVLNGNPTGIDIALKFLIENYQEMINLYKTYNTLTSLGNLIADRITNERQVNQLKEFLKNGNLDESSQVAINNTISITEANLKWQQDILSELREYYISSSCISVRIYAVFTLLSAIIIMHI